MDAGVELGAHAEIAAAIQIVSAVRARAAVPLHRRPDEEERRLGRALRVGSVAALAPLEAASDPLFRGKRSTHRGARGHMLALAGESVAVCG